MPAGLYRLHHCISAQPAVRSVWGCSFYITELPSSSSVFSCWLFSGSVLTPLPPHLPAALLALHISVSVLQTFWPTFPSKQFLLTHKRCQAKLAGVHVTKTACRLTLQSLKKFFFRKKNTPRFHRHTCL